MNPIINPWSIYLINVLSGLKNIFIAAVVAAIFGGIVNLRMAELFIGIHLRKSVTD